MAAFNWVNVQARCPACGVQTALRCQVHVASDYGGDERGRFHDREYSIGQSMRWWPREDPRFELWRASRWLSADGNSEFDEEACYATCANCNEPLYVVLRFRENIPERVVEVGKEAQWPPDFLR